jgi:hypothetical protein
MAIELKSGAFIDGSWSGKRAGDRGGHRWSLERLKSGSQGRSSAVIGVVKELKSGAFIDGPWSGKRTEVRGGHRWSLEWPKSESQGRSSAVLGVVKELKSGAVKS